MHYPGHNPYITQSDPFSFGWGTDPSALTTYQLPGYSYQGISPDIMSSLSNIFGGGYSGTEFDISEIPGINLSDFETYGGSDIDDIHMYWGPGEEMELWMSPEGTSTDYWTSHWGQEMEGQQTYFTPGEGYDPSLGILPFIDVFDPESLALGLSGLAGVDESIRAGEVRALTPEMIEKTSSTYYDPYEASERETLVESLGKNLGKVSTGGFAGSGGREAGLSGAERLYRGGYQDVLKDIGKLKAGSTEDVMDTIYGWQELMSNI